MDSVTIHYVASLPKEGKPRTFDSSRERQWISPDHTALSRNEPFVTEIGTAKVVKGLDQGIQQLSLGEKAIITIEPDFAYGERGVPGIIPPNSTLTYEVELGSCKVPKSANINWIMLDSTSRKKDA
ncbi:hypothetical protein D9611_009855 [Ephemerocybe angulata]|uniref:peptidylprolyl isomerase n=1 Tax=Ephemerocybe angulata TaxID=980116 RepID=A0A8H5CCT1_9AGAR|nr:hypothetical protein D9611_009855 [Tulosesus angulatus]